MKASGYPLAVSPLIIVTGGLALLLSPFGVFSICIAAITAAICQSLMPIRMRVNAGLPPRLRACFISWRAFLADRSRD